MSPPGIDAVTHGAPKMSLIASRLVRHSSSIRAGVSSGKMSGCVCECVPTTCPQLARYRISLAVAKVRWPIRLETIKKCPVQPRRDRTSAAYTALLPPSSKVSTRNRPGRVKSMSVTRVGRAALAAIWARWSSNARGVSV